LLLQFFIKFVFTISKLHLLSFESHVRKYLVVLKERGREKKR